MGTEVQYKSQLPEYNFMSGINEETYVSWPRHYHDRAQDRKLYNGFMQRSVNEYSEHDKEILKRTMLEQEDIFRKQVHELHRLYKIQKNLMDEARQYGSFKLPVQLDARQANSFPVPNEISNRAWERTCLVGNTSYGHASVGDHEADHVRPLNFPCRSTVHPTWLPMENGSALKTNGHFGSESRVYPREVVGLHLPADVYIQSETSEILEKGSSAKSLFHVSTPIERDGIDPNHDVRLTLGILGDHSSKEDNLQKNTHNISSATSFCFADLKTPAKDRRVPASIENDRPTCSSKWIQEHQFPLRSQRNTTKVSKDVLIGRCKEEDFIPIVSNEGHLENRSHDWSIFRSIEGQSRSYVNCYRSVCFEKPLLPSEGETKNKMTNGNLLSDLGEGETWLRKKLDRDVDILGKCPSTYSNDLRLKISPILGSRDTTSAQSASSTKARNGALHVPFSLPELPCFKHSDKLHSNLYEKLSPVGEHPDSNGYLHDNLVESASRVKINKYNDDTSSWFHKCYKHSQYTDAKSDRELNMDQSIPNREQVSHSSKQELLRGISRLSNKPVPSDSSEITRSTPLCHTIKPNALLSPPILRQEPHTTIENASFRGHINLNSAASDAECSDRPSISLRGKPESLSEISLDAPIPSPIEENMFSCSEAALIREAAENIISISFDNALSSSSPVECDSLNWFVDIVSNLGSDVQKDTNARESDDSQSPKDGELDLFESMTLRLQEIHVDEYLHRKHEAENQTGDRTGARLLQPSKSRRGKARKRRQSNDFQKDILPGITSLSRHGINVDLHTIGGFLKSYGRSLKSRRKNADGNKDELRGTVARQQRTLTLPATISESYGSLAPQLISSDVGWGRTTRRCRRSRCPPGNNAANLKV